MWLSKLSLENFRNYSRLTMEPYRGLNVLWGDNAQGKTNLLESIYILATSKSPRADSDRELIRWQALQEDISFLRIQGTVQKATDQMLLEVFVQCPPAQGISSPANEGSPRDSQTLQKRLKINGLSRRSSDFVGKFNSVLFSPQDIDLVHGSPSMRRRYLDITLCQLNNSYLRQLQRYNQILTQRNRLLRLLQEVPSRRDKGEMTFWNEAMVSSGSYVILQRLEFLENLSKLAVPIYSNISGHKEALKLHYAPSVGTPKDSAQNNLKDAFYKALAQLESKEIERGVSLAGPHRDDIQFSLDDKDVSLYGSRGQHRSIALAIKLAEARLFEEGTGEQPVILLDDVLSELDAKRRAYLLGSIANNEQVFLSTTDLDRLGSEILNRAAVYQVTDGSLSSTTTKSS